MEENKKRLFINALSLILMQAFNFLPLLIIPLLASRLGVEMYGQIIAILSISTFLYVLVDYGFNTSATYKISKHREDIVYISQMSSSVISIRILIAFALLFFFLLDYIVFRVYFESLRVVFSIFGILLFQSLISNWFFQGIEKMFSIAIYTILIRVLYAVGIYLFVNGVDDAFLVIYLWIFSNAIGAFFSIVFMKKFKFQYVLPSFSSIKQELRDGWVFFKSRVAVSLYTSINSVLLAIVSPISLAYYSIGDNAHKASQSVTSPINRAIYPYMVRTKDWSLFYRLFITVCVFLVLVTSLLGLYSETLIIMVLGSEFYNAILPLQIFLVTSCFTYVALTFGNPAFGALDKLEIPNKIAVFACLLHLSLLALLYFFYELNHITIAFALLATESFVAITRLYFFKRYSRD